MASYRDPSHRLTFDDAVLIWMRRLATREFQNRIAADYDVNPGRVNEVLKGKRHPGSMKVALERLTGSGGGTAEVSGLEQPLLV